MNHQDVIDLIPFYAAGSLGGEDLKLVTSHIDNCQECQAELKLWKSLSTHILQSDQAIPLPFPEQVLQNVRVSISAGSRKMGVLERTGLLLVSQFHLIQRDLWVASTAVFLIGFCAAVIINATGFFQAIAPLIAVASIATIYGPENDPGLELALATVTSPRQILLARMTLVFGYDLLMSLVASVGLVAFSSGSVLGVIISGWLAPMTFLSSLALLLSQLIGTRNAISTATLIWIINWMARGVVGGYFHMQLFAVITEPASAYAGFFSTTWLLFSLAGLLIGLAFWLVGRHAESFPQPV